MSEIQYRVLVGLLTSWIDFYRNNGGIDAAIKDAGIEICSDDVISHLWKCGWNWDSDKSLLFYDE